MRAKATTADAYELIHEGALALARAERAGIRIDIDYCEKKQEHLTRKIERLQQKLESTKLYRQWQHIYGDKTNIHSNHQLAKMLYGVMKIEPPKMTDRGDLGATDEEALEKLNVPGLDVIIQARKLVKIRDTYLKQFLREASGEWLHPNFNLHTVRTYRSSSANPNFQNIPKRDKEAMRTCRKALYPRHGHQLLEADFSAIEVNVSAMYHKDPVMIQYLKDPSSDMHADMAKQIFALKKLDKSLPQHKLLRSAAKNGFVFPQFYGDYYGNNAKNLADWVNLPQGKWTETMGVSLPDGTPIAAHLMAQGISDFDLFTTHLKDVEKDFWGRRFKVYHEWREEWVAKYRERGYLEMLTGFRCSGVMRRNEIINYPIQGTAFHCLLETLIQVDWAMRDEKWDSRIVGQIHDEIVMDVHPDEKDHVVQTIHDIVAYHLPEKWKWILLPLEVEVNTYEVDSPWYKD